MSVSEERLARSVLTELQRQGYETYEEVSTGNNRADIVAVRGPVVAIVECKVNLSLRLLDQLTQWIGGANTLIAAFGGGRVGVTVKRYCEHEGFGLWSVCGDEIKEYVAPRLVRCTATSVRRALRPEQQSGEYASAGTMGGYFTPFRRTVRGLTDYALKHPGVELRVALKDVQHHYSTMRSAVSAIPALVRRGVIQGLRVEGKPLRLYADPRCEGR